MILGLLVSLLSLGEPQDTIVTTFSDEYLDTVKIAGELKINNYSTIGLSWGVGFTGMSFNPWHSQARTFEPGFWSLTFTHYEKMFDYLPYFGFTTGVNYTKEGYRFEPTRDGFIQTMDGASQVKMSELEVPLLAHIHSDSRFTSFFAEIGFIVGYRLDIERSGIPARIKEDITHKWFDWDRRWEYGIEGGVGFALIFSPIEFHFKALCRYSWASLYEPDSTYNPYNRTDWESKQDLNSVYYRFAYPLDFMFTAGIHFQLGKRSGKTNAMLREEAKAIVGY